MEYIDDLSFSNLVNLIQGEEIKAADILHTIALKMEEKLQILEKWVATGQVKTARGRSHDDLLTLIGQMKVALRQPLVSGSLPCHHNFIQKDTYWKSCTHCGMLAPLGQ